MHNIARTSALQFRLATLAFSALLAITASWLLLGEFLRPTLPYFPQGRAEIEDATKQRDAALLAARIGWLRGDLWTDAAIATNSLKILEPSANVNVDDQQVIEIAARLAPHDARLWLLLAMIEVKTHPQENKTLSQIKMSFYTSPNDARLIPLRLQTALNAEFSNDDELTNLLDQEIRTILTRTPALKSAIVAAYRQAPVSGKRHLETTLAVLDRDFLRELRSQER